MIHYQRKQVNTFFEQNVLMTEKYQGVAGAVSRDEGNVRLNNQTRTAPLKTRGLRTEF
jgi:hypothetical protein